MTTTNNMQDIVAEALLEYDSLRSKRASSLRWCVEGIYPVKESSHNNTELLVDLYDGSKFRITISQE
jgi:hypothetical protein